MINQFNTAAKAEIQFAGRILSAHKIFIYWVLITIPLFAIIVGPSIPNDLITDDFWWLWRLGPENNSSLAMQPDSGHWSPTVQVVLALWYRLFGIAGAPYHLLTILLYWLSAVGLAFVARKITGNLIVGLVAGTAVMLNHQAAQIYTWAVGIWYPISALFFLLGLWGYLVAIEATNRRQAVLGYIAFLTGIMLGQLTHEQTWTLVGVAGLHTLLLIDRVGERPIWEVYTWHKLGKRTLFFIPPVAMVLIGVFARLRILGEGAAQPLTNFPFYEAWISILRTFLPGLSREMGAKLSTGIAAQLASSIAAQLAVFLLQYTILIVGFMLGNRLIKFLLLWTAAQVILMLFALGFLFPRHYFLATFPSIIMWSYLGVSAFHWLNEQLQPYRVEVRRGILSALAATVLLLALTTQIPQHRAFQRSWSEATAASSRSLKTIARLASEHPEAKHLVLLNFPNILVSENREWIGVFNAGTVEAVNFYVPAHFQDIQLMRTPENETPSADSGLPTNIIQPNQPNLYPGMGQDITFEQVRQLASDPSVLLVQFDIPTMNVFQVKLSR